MKGARKSSSSVSLSSSNDMRDSRFIEAIEQDRIESTARIRAEEAIYAHVSKWVGTTVAVGDPIPLLHVKPAFSIHATVLGGVPEVRQILDASKAIDTPALRDRVTKMKKLQQDISEMVVALSEFDPWLIAGAEHAARNLYPTLEGRLVTTVGACDAARLGLNAIRTGLTDEIVQTEHEISSRANSGPGRAKDEAAHRVALEAARFYAKVTGRLPTYSEGAGGIHGQYTPFLRDLYDAFGWKNRTLRTGAIAAIKSIEKSDLEPPRIPGLMSFLTGTVP